MNDENGGNKIFDLNDARKKNSGRPRQGAAKGGKDKARQDAAYAKALKAQKGKHGGNDGSVQWYHYVQTIGLLLLVAWMMKSCQS